MPDRSLSYSTVVCLGGMRVAAGRFVAMIREFRYTSVGFAHEMNENTTILRINIRQVSWAKPTLLVAATATLFLLPSGGRRLGWGWLYDLRENQIRTARRATLSPALSRRTGEGAGCTLRHRFLSDCRHSRVGALLSGIKIPHPNKKVAAQRFHG